MPYLSYYRNYRAEDQVGFRFKTYRLLRKVLKEHMLKSDEAGNMVHVCRSRRGEWGEWFEQWEFVNGRPKITKQGWM